MRKFSQLDLALEADISQRHISWLETGRSQPSREMVTRLSEAMDIPLRERNAFLQAAGFSAAYRETNLDEPSMTPVMEAVKQVLKHHDPLPAIVVDRFWNIKMQNKAAMVLIELTDAPEKMREIQNANGELNAAMMTLHPEGLRKHIKNWDQAAPAFIQRLKSEAIASGDPELQARLKSYIEMVSPLEQAFEMSDQLLPVLPLELSFNGLELSLFSVISTFGTPQDITTDELRIEAFYPTDEKTRAFFTTEVA